MTKPKKPVQAPPSNERVRLKVKLKSTPFKGIEFKATQLATEIPNNPLLEVSESAVVIDDMPFLKAGLIKFYPVYIGDLVDLLKEAEYREPITVFVVGGDSGEFGDEDGKLHAVNLFHPYTALYDMLDVVYVTDVTKEE